MLQCSINFTVVLDESRVKRYFCIVQSSMEQLP
jgi:hypothetical protein